MYFGASTVKVKVAGVIVAPNGLPVTCTWYVPVGVEEVVLTVDVMEAVGVTVAGLNEHEAPVGSVDVTQDKVTDCDVPPVNVAVTVFLPELACCTVMPPELDSE